MNSDCWGGLWIVALYTYTLIAKQGYHVGPVPWVLHVHTHTRTHTHTPWIVVCFVFTGVAAGCLVFCFYFCSVSSSLLFFFPCPPVRFGSITCYIL